MKIRRGFVSNSSSSSFILIYDKQLRSNDPYLKDKILDKDIVVVRRYDTYDRSAYYELSDPDKKKFLDNIDFYKNAIDDVFINAKKLYEDFKVTSDMVGRLVSVEASAYDDSSSYFNNWSKSLEEFLGDE